MNEFVCYQHCVVGVNLHLQFTPAYRRDIFCDPVLIRACRRELQDIAVCLGVKLVSSAFGPVHMHIFVQGWKNYSIPYLVQRFKGASSHGLREKFWERIKGKLWGKKFWSSGYFAETVGRITSQSMRHYIDCMQEKHWKNNKYQIYLETHKENTSPQTSLPDYTTNARRFSGR